MPSNVKVKTRVFFTNVRHTFQDIIILFKFSDIFCGLFLYKAPGLAIGSAMKRLLHHTDIIYKSMCFRRQHSECNREQATKPKMNPELAG